jgi:hypothetical protein
MKRNVKWLTAVIAIAGATANCAMADVTIDNFHNFVPNALYASWASPAATITAGPTTWDVSSVGYGSLWKYEGDINASGATQLKLSIDISGDPGVIAGPIVDLIDNNGTWKTFAWYGQTAGSYVLTADLSTVAGFNFADIQHIHLECDPGSFQTGTYDLNFKDLVVAVPEPASLALIGLGALGLLIARRHAR